MSFHESAAFNKRTELFDNQNALDMKNDQLTAMMSTLTTQRNNQDEPFKPKFKQGKNKFKEGLVIIIKVAARPKQVK